MTSNSWAAASSSSAAASRRARTSGGSVPRPVSLRTSSSQDGGARNTSRASGAARLTCRAPATSISSRQATPASSLSVRGARGVPYRYPANRAHSSSAPSAISRSNSASSTKQYSRPSTSPGRGRRVVTDTEIQISGQILRSSAMTVLFPTPEGPESTVSLECTGVATAAAPACRSRLPCGSDIGAELCFKRGALVGTQPAYATRFRYAQPFHDLLCPHLAHAGEGLKQSRDLHLANDVIGAAFLDDIRQGRGSALEPILHLGAFFACAGSLLQCRRTFFRSEGRKSHSGSPRVSLEKRIVGRGN